MPAFDKLELQIQHEILERIELRRRNSAEGASILLVGDRPAPSAPRDPRLHVPFGALKNSSLYINMALQAAKINEAELSWVNAADARGVPTEYQILELPWKHIIALGNKAAAWLKKSPQHPHFVTVHHPAAWKRFHSKEPYPLIELIGTRLSTEHRAV